jgi:hypothetical protein
MKKIALTFLLFVPSASLIAQFADAAMKTAPADKRAAITVGFLQGGGSLIGVDFEYLVAPRLGLQIGAGYIGAGAGIFYHLKPVINSSAVTLQYYQGFGKSAQDVLGTTFNFRARKLLSAQLGIGFPLHEGPAWPEDKEQPPVMLLYSIGLYFGL